MRSHFSTAACLFALISIPYTHELDLDVSNSESVKTAAKAIAQNLLGYYDGSQPGQAPGLFGQSGTELYWWQSGAAWGSLINYWNYTGDVQYNDIVSQGLLAQIGPNHDYMPPNQTQTEGNDDQGFWALATMTAAELHFPLPSTAQNTTWLDLAKNVFDLQASRWDSEHCGGGLRWQIFTFNRGYDFKNAITTGVFFQLAARLAQLTGNQTYSDWAGRSYDWLNSSGLLTSDFKVYDGTFVQTKCSDTSKLQWTYNAADLVYGSAVMYNITNGSSQWKDRVQGLLSALSVFTKKQNIIQEVACEPQGTCNYDQFSYKGIAAQWLGSTMQVAPFTSDTITPILQASAKGAAASCSGGDNKTSCGSDWTVAKHNQKTGFGQELSALNVIVANLAANSPAPSNANSTTSASNSGGSNSTSPSGSPTPSASPSAEPSNTSSKMFPIQGMLPYALLLVGVSFLMM
ncbi:hydrolase 76 protein [Lecanora helva]